MWETRKTHPGDSRARANFEKFRLHQVILTSVFENQKFDISPRDRRNPYAKMGEELPREGPPSMGGLYQPAFKKYHGGGDGFCRDTLYNWGHLDLVLFCDFYIISVEFFEKNSKTRW